MLEAGDGPAVPRQHRAPFPRPGRGGAPPRRQRRLAGGHGRGLPALRAPVRRGRARRGEAARLLPVRPARAARRRGAGRRDPPALARGRVRELHDLDPPGDRGGRAGRVLRVRLPLRPRGRLVLGPDARELLHGDVPVPVRARHRDLLRAPARQPFPRGGRLDPEHDAAPRGRLHARGAALRPPAQGVRAPLPHHVPAARAGGRRVPPAHRERRPRRGALRARGAAARRGRAARSLGPEVPAGARRARRSARGGGARLRGPRALRPPAADDADARRAARRPREPLARPSRPARHPAPDDRHRARRRQGGRHARRPRHPREVGPPLGAAARAARLVVRGVRRLLHVPRPERLLARAPRAAQPGHLPRRGRRGARADPERPVPRVHPPAVPGDARVLRPVADHRPLLVPPRGRVRERVHGQVRQRLLPEPGLARRAAPGVPRRGPPRSTRAP